MIERTLRTVLLIGILVILGGCTSQPETIRIATYNVLDVRTDDLLRLEHPRLKSIATTLQRLRPDVVLINEIAYDQPGVPGYDAEAGPGLNGQRFADNFLAVPQEEDLAPLHYRAFMRPSNTGIASGFDLDQDGHAVTAYPPPPAAAPDGSPASQTPEGRYYGNDNWGFGTFPGQYAMAVLVREDLEILKDSARPFQRFPWASLPGASRPVDPETNEFWYRDEIWEQFPLSSKSHWDVPVRTASGAIIHILASHPTPPAFDGAERRNVLRNKDEIRFWAAYLDNDGAIEDDNGRRGGLPVGASFVIAGDLNADAKDGTRAGNPMQEFILGHDRVNAAFVPLADSAGQVAYPDIRPDATSGWGRRIDYVLPSKDLKVVRGGIIRPQDRSSDHFPVFIDILVP